VSNRHGRGALPEEFPVGPSPFSQFCSVDGDSGVIDDGDGHVATFPLAPFLGLVTVASATDQALHSGPPGPHGGNLDVRDLGVGSRLHLPVQVEGALVSVGDPHYAQGHGEVALTAFEAPLRATVRFDVLPGDAVAELTHLTGPWGETDDHWIAIGLDRDLNVAMRNAVRAAVATVAERTGMRREVAYAYLSAAADFHVSQVVDGVVGVHATIDNRHFLPTPPR
jgi:acetamidase/formamidase